MAINWINDLGAPLAVTGLDLVVEASAPDWNNWAAYGTAGLAWLASGMGWSGDFVKNVAIASTPWAAKKLYQQVRGISSPVGTRLGMRKVSRYPAPLVEQPFGGARMV